MPESEPNKVAETILSLADRLVTTDEAFNRVRSNLYHLASKVSSEYAVRVAAIATDWEAQYVSLGKARSASKVVAQDALRTLEQYLSDVLPPLRDKNVEIAEKKRVIDSFVKNLKEDSTKEKDMSQAYVEIYHTIRNIVPTFDAIFDNKDFRSKADEYDALKKRIDDLQAEFDELMSRPMTPEEGQRTWDIHQTILSIRDRYFDLRYIVGNARVARTALTYDVVPSLDVVSTQISGLATVWAMIRSDCQQFYEVLDNAGDSGEFPALFKARVEASTTAYVKLRKGLETYVQKIGNSPTRLLAF